MPRVTSEFDDGGFVMALKRLSGAVITEARKGMDEAGDRLGEMMQASLRSEGKGGGQLEDSIGHELRGTGQELECEVGPGVLDRGVTDAWALTIDEGRTPGSKMPPREPIVEWLGAHGIPEEAEFPIRKKIGEEGLQDQPFPYITPAEQAVPDVLEDLGIDTLVRLVDRIGG